MYICTRVCVLHRVSLPAIQSHLEEQYRRHWISSLLPPLKIGLGLGCYGVRIVCNYIYRGINMVRVKARVRV